MFPTNFGSAVSTEGSKFLWRAWITPIRPHDNSQHLAASGSIWQHCLTTLGLQTNETLLTLIPTNFGSAVSTVESKFLWHTLIAPIWGALRPASMAFLHSMHRQRTPQPNPFVHAMTDPVDVPSNCHHWRLWPRMGLWSTSEHSACTNSPSVHRTPAEWCFGLHNQHHVEKCFQPS